MKETLFDYCIRQEAYHLLLQWDKPGNGALTPREISYGSHKSVRWVCEAGHRWEAVVYSRTTGGAGCPYCTGRKSLPNAHTLASAYPELAQQWHPTKNPGISPQDVMPSTHRKVWWRCEKGHEWFAQVNSRARGTGCPVCANRTVRAGENDLATVFPDIARQWDPEKNGSLTPDKVVPGSYRKVWWRCAQGHSYRTTVLSRTAGSKGCPVCAGKKVSPGENDLTSLFPQIAQQWHPGRNGSLTPEQVTAFSNRRVWWICEKGHEFQAVIAHRARSFSQCPYCTNRLVLPGFNDLATLHPKLAQQWHPELNGNLTPQAVTSGSRKKVWWQCPVGHVWKAVIFSRTGGRKCGCPVCAGTVKDPDITY